MEKVESEDLNGMRIRNSDSYCSYLSVRVKTQLDIVRPPGMRKIVIIELYQVISDKARLVERYRLFVKSAAQTLLIKNYKERIIYPVVANLF